MCAGLGTTTTNPHPPAPALPCTGPEGVQPWAHFKLMVIVCPLSTLPNEPQASIPWRVAYLARSQQNAVRDLPGD